MQAKAASRGRGLVPRLPLLAAALGAFVLGFLLGGVRDLVGTRGARARRADSRGGSTHPEEPRDEVAGGGPAISFLLQHLGYVSGNSDAPLAIVRGRAPRSADAPLLIVDVGMNTGEDYTLPSVAHGYKVLAFEPGLRKAEYVLRELPAAATRVHVPPADVGAFTYRAAGAPSLTLVSAAVGLEKGTSKFVVRPGSGEHGTVADSLLGSTDLAKIGPGEPRILEVPVVRLDDVVHEPVFILKSDAQGYDCNVLHGAERLLRERLVYMVTFELWPVAMLRTGCVAADLVRWLDGLGYACFDVYAEGGDSDSVPAARRRRRDDARRRVLRELRGAAHERVRGRRVVRAPVPPPRLARDLSGPPGCGGYPLTTLLETHCVRVENGIR